MGSLLPNVPFSQGQPFGTELADLAFTTPVFSGQTQYLGHREKLLDSELSDTAGQIKDRLSEATDAFKVEVVTGLTVAIAAGITVSTLGDRSTMAASQVTLADNSTLYIWINETGAVATGTQAPAIRLMLAQVVTSGGAVSNIVDLRSLGQRAISPVAKALKVFGGSNVQDYSAVQGDNLIEGIYYYRNFTVPVGVAITVDKYARILCSGVVNILGRIDITSVTAGAIDLVSILSVDNIGGAPGNGTGGNGDTYPFALQPYGSGGGTGYANGSGRARIGRGGRGGGSMTIEAGGKITLEGSSMIVATGTAATAPSELTGVALVSGSGGGSGGMLYLSSLVGIEVKTGSTVDLKGGNGSTGARNSSSTHAAGGGGGGGGILIASSPSNNLTGANILLTGGLKGADTGTPVGHGGGTGGGFGGRGYASGSNPAKNGDVGRVVLRNFTPVG